ncbi:MAG: tetratricopeptide repeat protein [Deltaproteobacteria bacterium]|nr:tetratricopeptide repeat protein [Deltaproteobacteria bacterium]
MSNEEKSTRTAPSGVRRKLAAILAADVKGYSRLMGEDEVATLRMLTASRQVTDTLIQQHQGRVVGSAGDSVLAEFASVVDAVQCAVEIQHALRSKNTELPEHRRMEFRIGINLGDVMVEGEQIYGDGVNIAARLEALAEGGGICVSRVVYEQVKNKLALRYEDLGEQQVKNIAEPVRVWRIRTEESGSPASEVRSPASEVQGSTFKVQRSKLRRVGIAHRSLLLTTGTIVAVRYLSFPARTQPPTPSTQLVLSPQDSALRTEAAPAALPLPDKPSIVVLPFVNMSNDPEQEYFSDGLTEVLTGDLSKLSSLFVIARNSAFTYKGKAVKVQEVSKELGVQYVLEGSVLKAEGQVRITAQLIDATTGYHLWSERYERPLKDIFALQDEIVQKILTALKVKLTQEEQARFKTAPTNNLEAYDYYLRGWKLQWRLTKETNAQARQLFEKALELDPGYATAHAGLSFTYWMEWFSQWSADPQNLKRATELAQQAIILDDSLVRPHAILGVIKVWQKQYEQGIAEIERAIALDPNDANVYDSLASALISVGQPEKAIEVAKKAVRLDPHQYQHFNILGQAYLNAGQYEEAIAALTRVLTYNPDYWFAHWGVAVVYSELGRAEEARKEGAEMLRIMPQFTVEGWKQRSPMKDPAATERFAAALRKAGLK